MKSVLTWRLGMGEMWGWDHVRRTRAWVGLGLYTPSSLILWVLPAEGMPRQVQVLHGGDGNCEIR